MQFVYSIYGETHKHGDVESGVTYVCASNVDEAVEIAKEYLEDEAFMSGCMFNQEGCWYTVSQDISFTPVTISEFLKGNKPEEILNLEDVEEE